MTINMIKWNYRVWEGQSIKKITECEKDNQFKKLQSVRRTINLKNYRVWEGQSIKKITECEKDNQLKKFNYLLGSAYTCLEIKRPIYYKSV